MLPTVGGLLQFRGAGRSVPFGWMSGSRACAREPLNTELNKENDMPNTPPPPPVNERETENLIEELCTELRHVACHDSELPNGERARSHIQAVQEIHQELVVRGANISPRLTRLSEETKWQMQELLRDCLAYPNRFPFVREQDGIARTLRCYLCHEAERPLGAEVFWFCDKCMNVVKEATHNHTPMKGLVLFRTYNAECRCNHADDDTVLATDEYNDLLFGVCEQCIDDEIERRKQMFGNKL